MVERANEVVDVGRFSEEVLDERGKGRADEFAFEADDDMDLGGVGPLEAAGFQDVGVVSRREYLKGGLGVVELKSFYYSS